LLKDKAELLGSRLKNDLLAAGTSLYWYRNGEQEFTSYFSQDCDLVYCCNIPGLMQKFGVEYKMNEWRLFIDSSKRSLKADILHNCSNYASLPIGHSVHLKENDENLKLVLTTVGYTAHDWMICGDLKLCMLLVQQVGYMNYLYFICKLERRARRQHWEQNHWTPRISLERGSKNILRKSLVDPKKILLLPLHI
jgi:hypothetical protein